MSMIIGMFTARHRSWEFPVPGCWKGRHGVGPDRSQQKARRSMLISEQDSDEGDVEDDD
jgi:hypothetical protein